MPEQATEHGAIVLLTALAVGLHLAYKDYLMSRHHDAVYLGWGRLALATAPLVAWAMAVAMPPSEMAADLVLALVAGYLLQHVFRNELPAEHLSSPASFAAGAALFGLPLAALAQLR
jgi:hypothetical protein